MNPRPSRWQRDALPLSYARFFQQSIFKCFFEQEVKNLFDKLNLNWEKQLYDFHKNERPVETASLMQVRSKIYKKSSEQWKNYKKYLTSMIDILSKNNVKF